MTELSYLDVRPILEKVADLERELVLVGGQAVNFWATFYEDRVPALAGEAPFTSKDIDFCGDQRAVRSCAERLGGHARVATFDEATPNSGTVVFVDAAGVTRTLDVVSAPFGLDAPEVHATALPVEILDDGDSGPRFFVMHPVLSLESRVHNVVGLPAYYDNEQGLRQLRASILIAHEFLRDVLDGGMDVDVEERSRTVLKLNERIFRFSTRDRHAKELYRAKGIDPAEALLDDERLPASFRTTRWAQMQEQLTRRGGAPR
ncbi:MAG: hypothetical protein KF764_27490 [Labilithrix sp.]|nr:hypothetical protein [Labilithrix sp.]